MSSKVQHLLITYLLTVPTNPLSVESLRTSDISDHFPQFIFVNEKKPDYYDKLKADKRNFSRSNIDQFKTFFNNHQWEEVLNCEDVQVAFDTFNDVFSTGFDQFFPLQKKRKNKFHKKQPWMTKGLLKSRNNSIKLRGIFQEFPTSTNRKVYTEYRNLSNKLKRIAKTNFYAERIDLNKGSARKTWNTLNEVLGKAKKVLK